MLRATPTFSIELECLLSMMLNTHKDNVFFLHIPGVPPLPFSSLSANVLPQALVTFYCPKFCWSKSNCGFPHDLHPAVNECSVYDFSLLSAIYIIYQILPSALFSHGALWFTSAPQQPGNSSTVLCQPSFGWASFWITQNFTGCPDKALAVLQ